MNELKVLPNFYGIFEVKSMTKNRIRVEITKLKNNITEINNLRENLSKISVVKSYKILKSLGSLTIEFDNSQVDAQFMLGIILKLLNLDSELFKERKGKVKENLDGLAKVANITLYNKTKGLFDLNSLAGLILLAYGIKKFKTEPILPSGATLLWWSYRLLGKNS